VRLSRSATSLPLIYLDLRDLPPGRRNGLQPVERVEPAWVGLSRGPYVAKTPVGSVVPDAHDLVGGDHVEEFPPQRRRIRNCCQAHLFTAGSDADESSAGVAVQILRSREVAKAGNRRLVVELCLCEATVRELIIVEGDGVTTAATKAPAQISSNTRVQSPSSNTSRDTPTPLYSCRRHTLLLAAAHPSTPPQRA
jgi:hypothetical protein